jgi:hypothetical protein
MFLEETSLHWSLIIHRMRITLPLFVCLVCNAATFADPGWLLTTADFRQQSVSLESIKDDGVTITVPGGASAQPAAIPFAAFLQLDRSTTPRPASAPYTLFLLSGDRVGGEPLGIENEQLLWKSPAVGELRFPLKSLKGLVRGSQAPANLDDQRTEDFVLMNNGDSVKGIVTALAPDKLTIEGDAALEVPMESVKVMFFALAGNPAEAANAERAFRVRFSDGSSVAGPAVRSDGKKLVLTLADKSTRELPLSLISGIEQLNGPVSWLSSRAPARTVQLPYFGTLQWPTRNDLTVGGRPIQFGSRTYSRGIGVHAYSRLDYALDGAYKAFRTQYAIAQEDKRQFADVTVRIKLDGKTVHEQANLKAETLSPVVLLDLAPDTKMLTLEVDYGSANDTQDRFNWIEPALLKEKPAAVEQPEPATKPATRPAAPG